MWYNINLLFSTSLYIGTCTVSVGLAAYQSRRICLLLLFSVMNAITLQGVLLSYIYLIHK